MTTSVADDDLIQQAQEAGRLKLFLEDSAVSGAFGVIESAAIKAWRTGKTTDDREAAHQRIRALDELKVQLKVLIDRGTWATDTLNQRQKKLQQDRARQKPS